jgi:signal transduction histidine kinase
LREEVLAAVSHDLRNPLTSIQATAQLVERSVQRQAGLSPERLITSMRRIQDATHRMEEWIGELIDVARLQAGQELSLRLGPTSLGSLVSEAAAELQCAAPGRRVLVHLPPAEVTGMWDATRLRRAIDNLLSNALKYSPSGEDVEVEVGQVEQQGVRWATLRVTDQGMGIPSADLPHLFEHFRRGRNVGWISGAGIGLASAHRIVQQHGGRLEVTSREGAGSSFTLWLPIQPSSGEGGARLPDLEHIDPARRACA